MYEGYYLIDGTPLQSGLMVTKTEDCPEFKYAHMLIVGEIVDGPITEESSKDGPACRVMFIDSDRMGLRGQVRVCNLRYLKLCSDGAGGRFDESEFMSMLE